MNGARRQEHELLELRVRRFSDRTVVDRDRLISDIDRLHGARICSALRRRFRLDDEESLIVWTETLLAAVLKPNNFQPCNGRLGAWLFGVSRRLAQKYVARRAKRPAEVTIRPESLDRMVSSQSLDAEYMKALAEERLSPLSDIDRRLLRARYLDGWSLNELAEATSKSPTAIESKIRRIVKKLQNVWAGT